MDVKKAVGTCAHRSTLRRRILVVHNAYKNPGGEDMVVEAETRLLRERGNEVMHYVRHNDDIERMSKLSLLKQTFWSGRTVRDVSERIDRFRPDVIHVHNTVPLVSPSVYWAAARARIPIIQTLHNFRLLCPQAMFLRSGKACEACLGKLPWRAAVHKCYRGSAAQSALLASTLAVHRTIGTYSRGIARYIALSEFCRNKFIEGGIPADRISVKPNFVDVIRPTERERQGGLFVGRLSVEKGVSVLLDAVKITGVAIRIVGAGPEESKLDGVPGVVAMGRKSVRETLEEMQRAAYLVMPSLSFEHFPRTLVEAFASGLPVIASRLGTLSELIEDGVTGLLFDSGSKKSLAERIRWAEANPDALRKMGVNARKEYEAKYTPDKNYEQLIAIYDQVTGLAA